MKKEYIKPELVTKAYAQFENVFTACNKNPAPIRPTCGWAEDEPGRTDCHHSAVVGSY